jgi:hypothetical protein
MRQIRLDQLPNDEGYMLWVMNTSLPGFEIVLSERYDSLDEVFKNIQQYMEQKKEKPQQLELELSN